MGYSRIDTVDLQKVPALQKLPMNQLEYLARVMTRQRFAPGEMIFLEGEASIGLWFILEGRVRIVKYSLNGRLQGLCMMNPGKCFGTCPMFSSETNPAAAQAIDEVFLAVLPQTEYQTLRQSGSQLASILLVIYSQRLNHLARLAEGLGSWTVSDRINDNLITYADHNGSIPTVALTHDRLASLAGTVREVVTRHLTHLEEQGIVRNEPGHITLLDLDRLALPCAYKP